MNEITLPQDFKEKVNKLLLFTGAGFSKYFGSLLADDMWPLIFNHEKINNSIKNEMLSNSSNYEDVLAAIKGEDDKTIFLDILKDIFQDFDSSLILNSHRISSLDRLNKFIDLFILDGAYNICFTINQDLILERTFLKFTDQTQCKTPQDAFDSLEDSIKLHFPYLDYKLADVVKRKGDKYIQGINTYTYESFESLVGTNSTNLPIKEKFNLVKLHGSFNWKHSEEYLVQISGKQKVAEFDKTKILSRGMALFKETTKNCKKIVVVGYGFKDAHINEQLIQDIDSKAEIIIINPCQWKNFKEFKIPSSKTMEKIKKIN